MKNYPLNNIANLVHGIMQKNSDKELIQGTL